MSLLQEKIELLKIKPIPQKALNHEIQLQDNKIEQDKDIDDISKKPESVDLDYIVDLTKKNLVDLDNFFLEIKDKMIIHNKVDKMLKLDGISKIDKMSKDVDLEKSKDRELQGQKDIDKLDDYESTIADKVADKMSKDIKKIKQVAIVNIKKTGVKIIIEEIEDGVFAKTAKVEHKRTTKLPEELNIKTIEIPPNLRIGRTLYVNRVPRAKSSVIVKASKYYLDNREIFINFINSLFDVYKQDIIKQEELVKTGKTTISCSNNDDSQFSLLVHQKIVRDYINLYTPYRGLLLYHGLGSGKTCTSIAIAEGLKNDKRVLIMTPASLRSNYIEELKKCGDYLYKKNQFWEFIDTVKHPELVEYLSSILGITQEYIKENKGAWFINVKKEPNYDELTFEKQTSLNKQLDKMISYKYEFLNYNGMRLSHLQSLSQGGSINPFSNRVIIIDEAHNFVSRIVNKLKKPSSLSMKLYNYLIMAENTKIVFLSGTPIINYPNEIAILFNILRGSITTYNIKLQSKLKSDITYEKIIKNFKSSDLYKDVDLIEFNQSNSVLTVTKNPFGFSFIDEKHTKIQQNKMSNDDYTNIIDKIINSLKRDSISIIGNVETQYNRALPDNFDEFKNYFIDNNSMVKNSNMFKMRILGLTSYFRSAQEELMPKYDEVSDLKVLEIEMSDFQFGIYEEARVQERKIEEQNKKKTKKKQGKEGDDIYSDNVSTYRIFSRAFCNFVFPRPEIKRPMPNDGETIESVLENEKVDQDIIDNPDIQEKINDPDGKYDMDDAKDIKQDASEITDNSYDKRIKQALQELSRQKNKYLSKTGLNQYSPKFLNLLENINYEEFVGIHLIYSQFRTLEGIGIFKFVLDANGYTEFKIKKNKEGEYELVIEPDNIGKPMYALYTGSETVEEREIIRNVLNSTWKLVPASIVKQITSISQNNYLGEIIKVLMITASGAEGITLKNVRYVHIMEPYWHPVRTRQVIGRARRICSHMDLPKELQTVEVFMYLMKFSDAQLESDSSIELRLKDRGKIDNKKVVTSDQLLYEISQIKEKINQDILKNVKESAIDCNIHVRSRSGEQLDCFSIGNAGESKYTFTPNIKDQDNDKIMGLNKKVEKVKVREIVLQGIKYVYDPDESKFENRNYYMVYDYATFNNKKELLEVARLYKNGDKGYRLIKI